MRVVKVLPFAIVIFLMGMNCIHGDPGKRQRSSVQPLRSGIALSLR